MLKLVEKRGRRGGARRVRLVQEVIAGQQPVRNELDVASRRNIFDAAGGRKLLRQSFHSLRHVGPIVVFALPQDYAIKGNAPGLLRGVRETQALEGYGEEHHIAVVPDTARVVPQSVEAEVVSLPFRVDGVGLYAERI